jgi:hypothetical protein
MLIDENGFELCSLPPSIFVLFHSCSVEPNLLETPQYAGQLKAFSRGIAIGGSTSKTVRLRCSLRFCDRLMGECDEILVLDIHLNFFIVFYEFFSHQNAVKMA